MMIPYTKDYQYALKNNLNKFHTLEYIPDKVFDINKSFKFIACSYYYLHKSTI